MKWSISITVFVMVLFLVLPRYGESEEEFYSELKAIKYFHFIKVYVDLDPDHGNISDLRSDALNDFLKLKYKNNFANFPIKDQPKPYNYLSSKEKDECGHIQVKIMTTGDVNPIAYLVELEVGNASNWKIYENLKLGYCNKTVPADIIKKAMESLLQDFAITFFKARGEM